MSEAIACLFKGLAATVRWALQRWTCNEIAAVVLPRGCGKTFICKSFASRKDNSILIDLEEGVLNWVKPEDADRIRKLRNAGESQTANTLLYPLAKQFVDHIRQQFRFRKIFLFSSDLKLINFLGISGVHTFVPSQEFAAAIEEHVELPMRPIVAASRMDLILAQGKKAIPFANWDGLASLLSQILGLTPKL